MPLDNKEREQYSWLPKIEVKGNTKNNTQSGIVFFIIDVNQLFGINLDFPGIKTALNRAFIASKRAIPVDTGLTKNSYTQRQLDNNKVYYFFDPDKIIGKNRKGVIVKDYYVQYIAESAKNFNWLSVVMKLFYDELFSAVKELRKKHKDDNSYALANLGSALLFKQQIDTEYKFMKEQKKAEIKKQKELQALKIKKLQQLREARRQRRLEAEDK